MGIIRNLRREYEKLKALPPGKEQERGYGLEQLMYALFADAGMASSGPFKLNGDQIDGAFVHRGKRYFLEVKWTRRKVSSAEADHFAAKLRRARCRGYFMCLAGFEKGVEGKIGDDVVMLLSDSRDLNAVLKQRISLRELLDVKIEVWPSRKFLWFTKSSRVFRETEWFQLVRNLAHITDRELRAVGPKYYSHLYVEREAAAVIEEVLKEKVLRKNLVLVVERAGSGKTNLVCHLAEKYSREHAVLFVRQGIQLNRTLGLCDYLQDLYGSCYPSERISPETAFLDDVEYLARYHGRKVIVLIDGINESPSPDLMKTEILSMLARWASHDVVFVVTCRDIYWAFFEGPDWDNYEFAKIRNRMYKFTIPEYSGRAGALRRYTDHYKIKGRLEGQALEKCRNPLLLRFFCEAYAGRDIGIVSDIRLVELFEEYWNRKILDPFRASHTVSSRQVGPGGTYLFAMVREMLKANSPSVPKSELPAVTGDPDTDRKGCVYLRLRDEDVILEEVVHSYSGQAAVKFVYEEFMEYTVARYLMEETKKLGRKQIVDRMAEFMRTVPEFLRGLGVMIFLAVMLRLKRRISIWHLLIEQNDKLWTDVLFEALRRLSEDGLDEATDELFVEVLSETSPENIRIKALELCAQFPYAGRQQLAPLIRQYAREDTPVAAAAARAMLKWPGAVFRQSLIAIVDAQRSTSCEAIAEALAERSYRKDAKLVRRLLAGLSQIKAPAIRARTIMALAAVGDRDAFRLMQKMVGDSSPQLRMQLATECRGFREKKSVSDVASQLLEQLAMDDDATVAEHALSVYGSYWTDRSVCFLMRLVAEHEVETSVRKTALVNLVQYAHTYCVANRIDINEADLAPRIERLCRVCSHSTPSPSTFLASLAIDPRHLGYSIHLAGIHGGEWARRFLADILSKRREMSMKKVALWEVWRVADREIVACLHKVATSGPSQLRPLAVQALGKVNTPDAVTILIECLTGSDQLLANWSLQELISSHPSVIENVLMKVVEQHRSDKIVLERLAFELRKLSPRVALPCLMRLQADFNPQVWRTAKESIRALGA